MDIIDIERIKSYEVEESIFNEYLEKCLERIDQNMDYFKEGFPHVSVGNKYNRMPNRVWTSAFFPGMVHAAYAITKDEKYLRNQEVYQENFKNRMATKTNGDNYKIVDTHDLGFLYTLSSVALYKLTGNEAAKELALKAANQLASRYNPRGKYIQAWGKMGIGVPNVKIIIDCMMNLPLLYWASEVTKDPKYKEIAKNHAITTAKTLVREDASVYHTYLFDPISGRPIAGKTHQGKYDESTWARGEAWCIYGYTLSYMYTKDPMFLDIAQRAADYYINNLPESFVHYWDFSVTDLEPEVRDTSAGSIGAAALLELAKYVSKDQRQIYEKTAKIILQQLCEQYYMDIHEPGYGLLKESFYNIRECNECTSWGDYFFVEALWKIKNQENDVSFW